MTTLQENVQTILYCLGAWSALWALFGKVTR